MTNVLDSLLARIVDMDLRKAISDEVARLKDSKDFGLVFERHLPESVRLPGCAISRGSLAQEKKATSGPTWLVTDISSEGVASLLDREKGTLHQLPVSDLVCLKGFGEAIYPGFKTLGGVYKGEKKSPNLLINGENFYVLQSLLYAFEEKVDAIYIDPPYNTGARDWKYDNNYVDDADVYRHSKWLAFMERRLKLAKRLLNPSNSVLIVTIDEKEYLRLGLLLQQVFPGARVQMVTAMTNKKGSTRSGSFSRRDEYIFYVFQGEARVTPTNDSMLGESSEGSSTKAIWNSLLRRGSAGSSRRESPKLFFPIWVDEGQGRIVEIGEAIPLHVDRSEVRHQNPALSAAWPIRSDGSEGRWQVSPDKLRSMLHEGTLRLGRKNESQGSWAVNYLKRAQLQDLEKGILVRKGTDNQGAGVFEYGESMVTKSEPGTLWVRDSHDASIYGSTLLLSLIPGRKFPFPKSLYAVEDSLRFVLADNPNALVVDFFAGSGTTGHALMRLNREDGGNRRFILVTNNEVSDSEATQMRKEGLRPGDAEWEDIGIFRHVTRPRLEAAISGTTPDGVPLEGEYKFSLKYPMSEGFEENVEFLELQYLDSNVVSRGKAFEMIAPLLWMKAGAGSVMLTEEAHDFSILPGCNYAILFDLGAWRQFVNELRERSEVKHVFVVTDSRASYQQVIQELGSEITSTMLYEDYLRNFEISIGEQG